MAKKDKEQEVVETAENTVADTAEETAQESDKVAELEKDLAAAKEAHIRTLAEYDNYRKRTAKEKENTWVDAKAVCLAELLPMLDNFDRALGVTDSDFESYKKGVEMIFTQFADIFKKLGVEAFGEVGEPFDPMMHNAVMHIDSEDFEESVVAQVFAKGYKLGDKIIRCATVQVAN